MTHTVEITLQPEKQETVGLVVQRSFRLEFDDRPENPGDEEEFRDTLETWYVGNTVICLLYTSPSPRDS